MLRNGGYLVPKWDQWCFNDSAKSSSLANLLVLPLCHYLRFALGFWNPPGLSAIHLLHRKRCWRCLDSSKQICDLWTPTEWLCHHHLRLRKMCQRYSIWRNSPAARDCSALPAFWRTWFPLFQTNSPWPQYRAWKLHSLDHRHPVSGLLPNKKNHQFQFQFFFLPQHFERFFRGCSRQMICWVGHRACPRWSYCRGPRTSETKWAASSKCRPCCHYLPWESCSPLARRPRCWLAYYHGGSSRLCSLSYFCVV